MGAGKVSRKDAFKIKDMIIENLKNMNKLISDSKEEEECIALPRTFFISPNSHYEEHL